MITLDWLHLTLLGLLLTVSFWHLISMSGATAQLVRKDTLLQVIGSQIQGQLAKQQDTATPKTEIPEAEL